MSQSGLPVAAGNAPPIYPALYVLASGPTYPAGDPPHDDCAYATATRVVWNATTGVYGAEPDGMTFRVFFPTNGRNAGGTYDEAADLASGDYVWAVFNPLSGRIEAIEAAAAEFAARWGALNDDLSNTDTEGVSVSLDSGGSQAGVLYPPGWPAGVIAEGARVLIARVEGEWYVILTPCGTEE